MAREEKSEENMTTLCKRQLKFRETNVYNSANHAQTDTVRSTYYSCDVSAINYRPKSVIGIQRERYSRT